MAEASSVDLEAGLKEIQETQRTILESFHAEIDALKKAINRIEKNVETVETKYKQSLGRHVTQAERAEVSAQISTLVVQTGKTSQAIRKRLRRIADENEQFARDYPQNTSALRIRVSTHQAVTHAFMETMQKLEDAQEKHHGAVKAAVERQLRLMNPDAPEEDIQAALQRGDSSAVVDNSPLLCELPAQEQKQLRAQLDMLTSRNNDIRVLEHNIVELHQMFLDMQLLVERQGDLLNTIEFNVQETKGKAEAGLNELVQAHDFQKKVKRKKCYIFLLLVVLIIVISVPVCMKFAPQWFPTLVDSDPATDGDAVPTSGPTLPDGSADETTISSPSPSKTERWHSSTGLSSPTPVNASTVMKKY